MLRWLKILNCKEGHRCTELHFTNWQKFQVTSIWKKKNSVFDHTANLLLIFDFVSNFEIFYLQFSPIGNIVLFTRK